MLKKWREVCHTGDGAHQYQCLACGNRWEAVTSPAGWAFCPHCATAWEGQHEYPEPKRCWYPRRLTPNTAVEWIVFWNGSFTERPEVFSRYMNISAKRVLGIVQSVRRGNKRSAYWLAVAPSQPLPLP
jgi:hypothetical protein